MSFWHFAACLRCHQGCSALPAPAPLTSTSGQESASHLPLMPPRPPAFLPQVFRRVELGKGEEEYRLIGSFSQEPKAPQITDAFRAAWAAAAKQA